MENDLFVSDNLRGWWQEVDDKNSKIGQRSHTCHQYPGSNWIVENVYLEVKSQLIYQNKIIY